MHFDAKKTNCEQLIGILGKKGYFRLSEAETCDERVEKATEKVLELIMIAHTKIIIAISKAI